MHQVEGRALQPLRILLALALVGLGARSATADMVDFQAQLTIGGPGLANIQASGTGVAEVNSGVRLDLFRYVAGHVQGADSLVYSAATPGGVVSIFASAALAPGTISFTPSGLVAEGAGTLGVPGNIRLCLLVPGCWSRIDLPLTAGGTQGAGLGGYATFGGTGTARISLQGAPWTVTTTSVTVQTHNNAVFTVLSKGFRHGPLSFSGTTLLNAGGAGGAIQLVTPIRVISLGQMPTGGFAALKVTFLPEPGPLLGLGSGALVLGILGLRRHRDATRTRREVA